MTAEQLEASRAERMRLNGHGALTLEEARTWIEETGLCLFLPKRQFASSIAPTFVEAVAGQQSQTPDPKHIALAEELLVRLETDGVAVRLNLLGQAGEQPDFVVAGWVLPYVYALRGDRDWRRSPQLTGSRQVSQLAVLTYKLLEAGDSTIPILTHALGREVTEGAVLRAITELWQQLRIIPVVSAPGETAQWQLLRSRFQKAIAEGASTSQVTAISVLASIYLQAVIAASMEDVEMFLAPLTARSKVREVLRGLVATRQVHSISLGHAPHFYVAGTLPEFSIAPTMYASSSMPASAYFLRSHEEEMPEPVVHHPVPVATPVSLLTSAMSAVAPIAAPAVSEAPTSRVPAVHKPAAAAKPAAARPHFSRPAAHTRDRKPATSSSSSSRTTRRPGTDTRSASARPTSARPTSARPASGARPTGSARPASGSRPASSGRWTPNPTQSAAGKRPGAHASNGTGSTSRASGNGSTARPAKTASGARSGKPAAAVRGTHSNGAKPAAKSGAPTRSGSMARSSSAPRKDARPAARSTRKPAFASGAKAGASKRYGFAATSKQNTKKRG